MFWRKEEFNVEPARFIFIGMVYIVAGDRLLLKMILLFGFVTHFGCGGKKFEGFT